MTDQTIQIYVHNARVAKVWTLEGYPADHFVLDLGSVHGTRLTFHLDDARWDDIVAEVAEKRIELRAAHTEKITIAERLEYLRSQLRAESISTGELIELQGLAEHIAPGDVELLEAAGVPEEVAANIVVNNPRMLADALENTEALNDE